LIEGYTGTLANIFATKRILNDAFKIRRTVAPVSHAIGVFAANRGTGATKTAVADHRTISQGRNHIQALIDVGVGVAIRATQISSPPRGDPACLDDKIGETALGSG
jgi:hypothetical protein